MHCISRPCNSDVLEQLGQCLACTSCLIRLVALHLLQVDSVDDTAALAIEEILAKGMSCGKRFIVCGASDRVVAMFDRLQMTGNMPIPPNVSRQAALEAALA